MQLQQRLLTFMVVAVMSLGGALAATEEKLTPPKESIGGVRPGMTLDQVTDKYGKPAMEDVGGFLELYGGPATSDLYGWFMVENPQYTIPDLALETAKGSDRIDLVMAIGYGGLATEKGIHCFQSADEMKAAYGDPAFVFAVPLQSGVVLHEVYYPELGLSFDLAPTGPTPDRQIVAMYVSYPEHMARAIAYRQQLIDDGVGRDITAVYRGASET